MNWKYFIFACTLSAAALLKAGAPPLAVASGIGFATLINLARHRKESLALKQSGVRTPNS
jgi:hypothetical protein